jgi:hypothetical protein
MNDGAPMTVHIASGGLNIAPKVDPTILEREFVTTGVSIRELAKRYGMSWSAIATRARKQDAQGLTWYDKKETFRSSLSAKSYDKTVEKFATEEANIREELVLVHRATIHAYAAQLRVGNIAVTPKDAVQASQALLLLLGDATVRTETKTIGITANLPIDDLRQLAELARSRLIEGTVASVTGPEPEGTRPN